MHHHALHAHLALGAMPSPSRVLSICHWEYPEELNLCPLYFTDPPYAHLDSRDHRSITLQPCVQEANSDAYTPLHVFKGGQQTNSCHLMPTDKQIPATYNY